MPPLLHQYFLADFHLSEFAITNQHSMNEEYLRTYVDNNCVQDVVDIVKDMFDHHKMTIKINKGFPKDQLFSIMKPYLHLYFISNYSLNEFKKRRHYKILHRKLHDFVTFNPTFGRKKVRFIELTPFSKKKIENYFDDKHIDFNKPVDCENSAKYFLNSHLCKKEFYNRNLFYTPQMSGRNPLSSHFIIVNEQDEDEEDNSDNESEHQTSESDDELREEYHQYPSESDSDTPILEDDSDIES
jgi:hypothetical protein